MTDTRLAAIMFTDIVGYSRLMEEDEVRTIEILREHNDVVFAVIEQAGGTVVDAIGDGLLVTFPSVLLAVRCAVEIQAAVEKRNEDQTEDRRFYLRIGIHLGEIWEENDRVFGNGVNVAARTQPFAPAGGICITEDVQRQVANKLTVPIVSIGSRDLKNISRTIELFRVVSGHEAPPEDQPQTHRPHGDTSGAEEGNLDEIKERLLEEREKIASQRSRGESGSASLGQAIENRVFNIVERAMDVAIDKWDKMPEDKRREALQHAHSGEHSVITVGPRSGEGKSKPAPNDEEGKESEDGKPGGDLSAGAVFGVGFGVGYFVFGIGWMIWPFLLIGVLPFLSGLRKVIRGAVKSRRRRQARPQRIEREILEAAKRLGGRVTVVQISAETDLSLDEAQEHLERMAAKGYVTQEISNTGVIEFEFPALVSNARES